jgi:uncharacterized membrane protein YidH (DUF202 family)
MNNTNEKNIEMITEDSIKNIYLSPELKKNDSSFLNINDIIITSNDYINKKNINKEINKNKKINYKNIITILIILIIFIVLIVLYIIENKKYNECQLKYNEYKKQLK